MQRVPLLRRQYDGTHPPAPARMSLSVFSRQPAMVRSIASELRRMGTGPGPGRRVSAPGRALARAIDRAMAASDAMVYCISR